MLFDLLCVLKIAAQADHADTHFYVGCILLCKMFSLTFYLKPRYNDTGHHLTNRRIKTMKTKFVLEKLDVAEFARQGAELSGTFNFDQLSRLAELCFSPLPAQYTGQTTVAQWRANGEMIKNRLGDIQIWLHLHITATVPLRCERCLHAVETQVEVDRSFRFVSTEEQAILEDSESSEDVLTLTKMLDLPALCEDELILALPLMPLHEVCDDPLISGLDRAGLAFEVSPDEDETSSAEQEAKHPFAALQALKNKLH